MGNNKCKQCTTSVFENEEEEETWFEWMESTGERNQKSITPRTQPLPVQPLAFCADVIDRSKKRRSKPTEGNVLKRLQLANSEDDRIWNESSSRRDMENNNSPRINSKLLVEEEPMASQIFPDFPAGEVNVSLTYEKSTSRLKLNIVKARSLCCKALEGKRQDPCGVSCSELYINASLLNGQGLLQSYRTSKKKGGAEILFYENYAFDLTSLCLHELTLRLTAMHCCKHVISTHHVIGHADTDDKSSETSFGRHWLEVITCSGRNVNRWHTLWC